MAATSGPSASFTLLTTNSACRRLRLGNCLSSITCPNCDLGKTICVGIHVDLPTEQPLSMHPVHARTRSAHPPVRVDGTDKPEVLIASTHYTDQRQDYAESWGQ